MANGAVQSVGKNPIRVLVIVGSLIIVALLGVIVALVMNLNRGGETKEPEEAPAQRAVLVSEENMDEVIEEMTREPAVPRGLFEVSMNMEWNFPDGASPSTNAYVENVANNNYPIYFDVTLRDTGRTIYRSPVLPLGTALQNFALDENLGPGTYDCVCVYHLVDEQQNTLSTLNMAVTVNVER